MSEKKEQQIQTAIRLPASLLARADKLAAKMTQPGLRIIRADVIRMAACQGIEMLETRESDKKR